MSEKSVNSIDLAIEHAVDEAIAKLEADQAPTPGVHFVLHSLGSFAMPSLWDVDYRARWNVLDTEADSLDPPLRTLDDPTILTQLDALLEAGLRVKV